MTFTFMVESGCVSDPTAGTILRYSLGVFFTADSQILWSPSKRPPLLCSHLGQSNKLVSRGAHLHHKSGLDFARTRSDEGRGRTAVAFQVLYLHLWWYRSLSLNQERWKVSCSQCKKTWKYRGWLLTVNHSSLVFIHLGKMPCISGIKQN